MRAFTVRLSDETYLALKMQAARERGTMVDIVRDVINVYLREEQERRERLANANQA